MEIYIAEAILSCLIVGGYMNGSMQLSVHVVPTVQLTNSTVQVWDSSGVWQPIL